MPNKSKSKRVQKLAAARATPADTGLGEVNDVSAAVLDMSIGETEGAAAATMGGVEMSDAYNPMFGLDPRATLTVKATKTKAIHIIEFLPDHIRRKRAPKSLLRVDTGEDGEPCIHYQEAPTSYDGISMNVWGAANMRLLNFLINTGRLDNTKIAFYLAYSAHIFDLAERYLWSSIMEFDKQYRELQAEYSFPWGTFAAQLEMKTLVLKQASVESERSVHNTSEECRMYKARGWCSFGGNCKYRHVQSRRGDTIQGGGGNEIQGQSPW
jgi:hypothetical protein